MAKFKSTTDVVPAIYKPGEKFAQLVFVKLPEVEIEEVTDLGDSERGEDGYGSSDNSAVMDSEQPNTVVEPTNEQAAESNDSEQA